MLRTAGIFALVLLAGCATPEQRAMAHQAQMDRTMQEFGPACSRLGYQSGTDQWRNCVLQLSVKEDLDHYGYGPHYYAGLGRGYWGAGGRWGPYW
jgi:hypothetical protein